MYFACICQEVFKTIMPSYLTIACDISFNRQSLKHEETTDFIDLGCMFKDKMHENLHVFGMQHLFVPLKDTSILLLV